MNEYLEANRYSQDKKINNSYLENNRYSTWQRENDENIYTVSRMIDPTTLQSSFFLWCKEDGTKIYDLTQDNWHESTNIS